MLRLIDIQHHEQKDSVQWREENYWNAGTMRLGRSEQIDLGENVYDLTQ